MTTVEEDMLSHVHADIDGVAGCGDSESFGLQEQGRAGCGDSESFGLQEQVRFMKYMSSSFYHLSMPLCGDHGCPG
jgi:hypothetical protein